MSAPSITDPSNLASDAETACLSCGHDGESIDLGGYCNDPVLDVEGYADVCECHCREGQAYDCGHVDRTSGCGGCDPGAIQFVIDGDGQIRPFDPARDLVAPSTAGTSR